MGTDSYTAIKNKHNGLHIFSLPQINLAQQCCNTESLRPEFFHYVVDLQTVLKVEKNIYFF